MDKIDYYQHDEPTKEEVKSEIIKRFNGNVAERIQLERKIHQLQERLSQVKQWIWENREEAKKAEVDLGD
jgi:hypothetical protein